jgi:hypothetical protein
MLKERRKLCFDDWLLIIKTDRYVELYITGIDSSGFMDKWLSIQIN